MGRALGVLKMLKYILLAVFVFVVSVITIWVIRRLKSIGNASYGAFLPSRMGNIAKPDKKLRRFSKTPETLPKPWGW